MALLVLRRMNVCVLRPASVSSLAQGRIKQDSRTNKNSKYMLQPQ